MTRKTKLTDHDYERLLEFRTGLRTFLAWSKGQAAKAGLAPSQHQLLLAIRGHPHHDRGPTIGDVAAYLLVKPHSAAELVARAEKAGLVIRFPDPDDRRVVRLRLTRLGGLKLASITEATLEELDRMGPRLRAVWKGLESKDVS
jgi:DNA-binding MarR family transcriptional regulator